MCSDVFNNRHIYYMKYSRTYSGADSGGEGGALGAETPPSLQRGKTLCIDQSLWFLLLSLHYYTYPHVLDSLSPVLNCNVNPLKRVIKFPISNLGT